jgi:alkylated DNA repair dioxygenase AlkB
MSDESNRNELMEEISFENILPIEKTPKPTLNYDPANNLGEEIIYLNNSKTSYLKISHLPRYLKKHANDNFDKMFSLHPEKKHKIIMYSKEIEVNRWQKSYLNSPCYDPNVYKGRSYMYSGFNTIENNNPLPESFQTYFDYVNSCVVKSFDEHYNQVGVNWYQDEKDYISYHSDCELGMVPNASILVLSLYANDDHGENYRVFSILPKNDTSDVIHEKVNIVARHGTMIMMCGNTQKEFRHGIEKTKGLSIVPRISMSFRRYKNNN